MINEFPNEHNKVKNPNWQEADQLAICKRSREVELRATENNISKWSERDLNLRPTDFKSGALTTRPHCLVICNYKFINVRPFFHFWCATFDQRSFQWYPDQSDQPNGALHMHKNAHIVEQKTQNRISYLNDAFSELFEEEASPVEGQPLQQKEKKKEERQKKN